MESRLSILCIDDDPDIREATVRVARRSGHDVRQAATGKEGLALAIETLPDILLLDNVLPDLGGLEIAQRLKSDPKTAGIYIAILSGTKIESGDKVEGFEAGADEYIARPIPNRELRARLQAMIRLVQTEKRLRASLRERDFFLRELNHRTRNNFALAASLLNLEAEHVADARGKAALLDSRERMKALAMVHDQLFRGISHPFVSARKYLGDLARSLHKALAPSGVSLDIDVEEIDLNLRQAIPCGLIVNELMTNAFKYAFAPERREGGLV
ncbi:MAG: response regulator, partial [Candidatus Aminicenantes bacterium]|nr:response regulator [Candidatus Aminicenantes bacterium]